MNSIAPYAKAIVASLIAGLASLQQALDGDNHVTANEWVSVAVATLLALGAVFAIPNRDPEAAHQDESVQPPYKSEAGQGIVHVLVIVVVVLLAIWLLFMLLPRA